jgi:hypothetical protein
MLKIFMYKNGTGTAEIFDADNIPKTGYSDNPKTAMVGKGTTKAAAAKPAKKKRARKDGKFVADDPSTPDVNEAFEQ